MQKIRLDQFTEYRFCSNLQASPQAETAAFVMTQANANNGYDNHLWLLENQTVRQLTSFNESNYIWEDEQTLLFVSLRDSKDKEALAAGEERTAFYRLNIHQGEAQKAFTMPYTVTNFKKMRDGKLLLTIRYHQVYSRLAELAEEEKKALLKKKKEEQDYQIVSESPYYFDGAGFTNGLRNRLAVYDPINNTVDFLTAPTFAVSGLDLDADTNCVVFWGAEFAAVKEVKDGLYVYNLNDKKMSCLIEPGKMQISFAHWRKNGILCAMSDGVRYGAGETPKLFLIDPQTKAQTLLNDNDATFGNAVGTDCAFGASSTRKVAGEDFYAVMTDADHTPLVQFDKQGKRRVVLPFDGAIFGFDLHGDTAYLIAMKDMQLQEIYQADLKTGELVQCSHFNQAALQDHYVALPERLDYAETPDRLWGWVLKPKDYDPSKIYPAILDIHGGPRAAYGPIFYHEMQLWANEGYFVFFCNVHGSDGRGDAFADLRGQFGTIDFDDFMQFTDAVLKAYPQIDPNRIGVTGGSYGGYMTNWIIGHTDRFVCAASQRSISNWVSENMVSDIGFSFGNDQMDATPWSDVNKIWDQSPLKAANQCVTPTLFIHSFEDYRCPIQEGMQMYNALVHHGVQARMCLFKGESHGLSRGGKPLHRIRRLQEITDWMNQFCKKEEN